MTSKKVMVLILLISYLLRVYIVFQGGQFFWPDEGRYPKAVRAVNYIFEDNNIRMALFSISSSEHMFFKVVAIIPATIQHFTTADYKIPALFFSIFSVINLYLVWKISLVMGAKKDQALLAVFLLALSANFFYYSRHLLPYDVSLTFGLLALLIGIRKSPTLKDTVLSGILVSLCLFTYYNYWSFALFVLFAHLVWSRFKLKQLISRSLILLICLLLPIFIIISISSFYGADTIKQITAFSNSVNQGKFSEGGRLPFAYLWHAEHFLFILWLFTFIFFIPQFKKDVFKKKSTIPFAGIIFIYVLLFLSSVVFEKFVVYGRGVRPLIPLFCLITADRLYYFRAKYKKIKHYLPLFYFLIFLQASYNFYTPLTQIYPENFKIKAEKTAKERGIKEYQLKYAYHIYPTPEEAESTNCRVFLTAPHPLQYLPNQYEGYTPEEREKLRKVDISMKMISCN